MNIIFSKLIVEFEYFVAQKIVKHNDLHVIAI